MTAPRMRSVVVSLSVSTMLASFALLAPAHAQTPPAARHAVRVAPHDDGEAMLALVNRSRLLRGLPALRMNQRVSREALAHSRRMSHVGDISHTPGLVAIIVRVGGTVFGEDVGRGRGLRGIRDAWMGQSDTRQILLDRRFRRAGVGVVRVGGFFWVTLQAFN